MNSNIEGIKQEVIMKFMKTIDTTGFVKKERGRIGRFLCTIFVIASWYKLCYF